MPLTIGDCPRLCCSVIIPVSWDYSRNLGARGDTASLGLNNLNTEKCLKNQWFFCPLDFSLFEP